MVTSRFYNVCVTSGVDGGKPATLFDVIDQKFTR